MKPTFFLGANDVLSPPKEVKEEDCNSLIIHRGYDKVRPGKEPVITSAWDLSEEEIQEIIRTKKIYQMSWGHTIPPISLTVHNPVEAEWVGDKTPLQPNHPLLNNQ